MIAIAMGNNISAVAVLEIHILSSADVSIKPNTKRLALDDPHNRSMYTAIRLCTPDFSSALESINAPISNKITWLPSADDASL